MYPLSSLGLWEAVSITPAITERSLALRSPRLCVQSLSWQMIVFHRTIRTGRFSFAPTALPCCSTHHGTSGVGTILWYLLQPTLVYKPRDLNRDWSPRFSTLWDKNGWILAKPVGNLNLILVAEVSAVFTLMFSGVGTALQAPTPHTHHKAYTAIRICEARFYNLELGLTRFMRAVCSQSGACDCTCPRFFLSHRFEMPRGGRTGKTRPVTSVHKAARRDR